MEQKLCLDWELFVNEAIKRRKEIGYSQRRLAAIAGISQPTLSQFEQKSEHLQLRSAFAILKALGLLKITKD